MEQTTNKNGSRPTFMNVVVITTSIVSVLIVVMVVFLSAFISNLSAGIENLSANTTQDLNQIRTEQADKRDALRSDLRAMIANSNVEWRKALEVVHQRDIDTEKRLATIEGMLSLAVEYGKKNEATRQRIMETIVNDMKNRLDRLEGTNK